MKKVLFLILVLFIFGSFVNAQDLELTNKIIEFEKISDYGLQGITTTDKYLIALLIKNDDSDSIIKVFDLNTYNEVQSIDAGSLGHANDVTYNGKTNRFYVIASSGSSKMFEFDANSFEYIRTIFLGRAARSITYIDDMDIYAIRLISIGYFLDNNFVSKDNPFISKLDTDYDVGRQGWAYYNNYIYYANWSWVSRGGSGDNTILVYDLSGNFVDSFVTNNQVGEIEGVSFYEDKMILGFNGYDNKVKFYLEDIPETSQNNLISQEDTDDSTKSKNTNYLYFLPIIPLVLISIICIKIKHR